MRNSLDLDLDLDLSCIRVGTSHDLADAQALAARLLGPSTSGMDFLTYQFSADLLVLALMTTVYGQEEKTLATVLFFLVDPAWVTPRQITSSFARDVPAWNQPDALKWRDALAKKWQQIDVETGVLAAQIRRCHTHWQTAFALAGAIKTRVVPDSAIQILDPQAVAKSLQMVSSIQADKRAGADQILQNAQVDGGYRLVPDARQAHAQLEEAKARFENLVEPISRLQIDLVLAAAMRAQDFHITPILLLGEPGIGKTYLATQLADALGVDAEKISAGGGHASFQFTGSHPTWIGARPGSVATLLAQGKSTSPVLVIDEVDKIAGDCRYPVLPLLLDLLEPHTARKFKDQFLDLELDASRMIFILTANTLDGIPPALLSRVEVFHVPRPERAQRLRIIHQTHANLCAKTDQKISLDEVSCTVLASRTDLDVRKLMRLVREAFARALQAGQAVAELVMPALEIPDLESQKTEIGRKPEGQKWEFH